MSVLSNEKRAAILALSDVGIYPDEVARTLKVSPQSVSRLLSIDEGVKSRNADYFAKWPNNSYGFDDFEYCCQKYNVNADEFKEKIRLARVALKNQKSEPKKYEAIKTSDIPDEEPKEAATPVYCQQILLNQAKIIELFEQLCDVVFPHYVTEIKKNVDSAIGDAMTLHLNEMIKQQKETRSTITERMRVESDSTKLMLGDCVRSLNSIKDNVKKKR